MKKILYKILVINLIFAMVQISIFSCFAGAMDLSDCHSSKGSTTLGDDTEKEYEIRPYYSRVWDCILRYPDEEVAERIALVHAQAATNNNIGYSQNARSTYLKEVEQVGWDPLAVRKLCAADCSSSVQAAIVVTGYQMGIEKFQKFKGTHNTTQLQRKNLMNLGFQCFTDREHVSTPNLLKKGDILLDEDRHTAVYIGESHFDNSIPNSGNGWGGPRKSLKDAEIDDIVVDLDELVFKFPGAPSVISVKGSTNWGQWIFTKLKELIGYLVMMIITLPIRAIMGLGEIAEYTVNLILSVLVGSPSSESDFVKQDAMNAVNTVKENNNTNDN